MRRGFASADDTSHFFSGRRVSFRPSMDDQQHDRTYHSNCPPPLFLLVHVFLRCGERVFEYVACGFKIKAVDP